MSSTSFSTQYLRTACENFKQKYLSVFSSKLSAAQLDFNKSSTQVCNAFGERKNLHTVWWLDALNHAEQNKDSTGELIRKIEEAVSGTLNNSRSSRIASRLRSITGLKYHIQTHLDQLEASRQTLLDRILEIDQTMANPKEEDIERVRHCRICQAIDNGPTCVHCELEESFQEYESRLFRLNKLHGGITTSAEEAVNLLKRNSERNRYYWNLERQTKNLLSSSDFNEESKKRKTGETVMIPRGHLSITTKNRGVILSCRFIPFTYNSRTQDFTTQGVKRLCDYASSLENNLLEENIQTSASSSRLTFSSKAGALPAPSSEPSTPASIGSQEVQRPPRNAASPSSQQK
ncbi:uncharacterized protein LOC127904757 [Populus trichocarpa]|uniref:uncharacterized protein LOC127904757 n=1 Tax=Populus trichocarpa TaxID=3694 RepID=UPI0022775B01|nr:uncharacterized protein LOC127904757 [Populus trichocarpa]